VNTKHLRPNFRLRISEYYKIKVVSIDPINRTVRLRSDALVVVPADTALQFEKGVIRLSLESLVPDWESGSVDHLYTLESGSTPSLGDCTAFTDPITGQLKQYEQTTVLECSVYRLNEPVPESLAGVDHNALRLKGRILTPYNRPIKPGLYDAESSFSDNQKSVGKFMLENNISDSIEGHEQVLGVKISGWFQSYLVK
jgi:hypothetical protein